jgi:WD40 repeat protein
VVRLIEPDSGVRLELTGHHRKIRDVAFDREGRLLASGASEAVVRVWDVQSGAMRELVGHESSIERVRFSPVEDLLATSSLDGTIRLWRLSTGASRVLRSGVVHPMLEFSPDGKRLYGGGADGVLREWDVASASLLRVWRGHEGEIQELFVPRRAPWVATYADDHTVRVWPLSGAARAPSLSELTSAELGPSERPVTP